MFPLLRLFPIDWIVRRDPPAHGDPRRTDLSKLINSRHDLL
jgi:hypothetical protein